MLRPIAALESLAKSFGRVLLHAREELEASLACTGHPDRVMLGFRKGHQCTESISVARKGHPCTESGHLGKCHNCISYVQTTVSDAMRSVIVTYSLGMRLSDLVFVHGTWRTRPVTP